MSNEFPLPPSRRSITLGGLAAAGASLAGCSSMRDMPMVGSMFGDGPLEAGLPAGGARSTRYDAVYGVFPGEPYDVVPFEYTQVDPQLLRRDVAYTSLEEPGTIVVDPKNHFLYHVKGRGRATRYGVGVGREGFGWSGKAQINMKRAWADWVPPREMVERDPEIRNQLSSTPRGLGVPGGPKSPLGARTMYLFGEGIGDLGYRIHGTTEPTTIGTNVSSGCIRLVNQDIMHLYAQTSLGTRVAVLA